MAKPSKVAGMTTTELQIARSIQGVCNVIAIIVMSLPEEQRSAIVQRLQRLMQSQGLADFQQVAPGHVLDLLEGLGAAAQAPSPARSETTN
ncbi:hypothetical protein [Lysobacter soli]|uniref:hypothetical protein n=1 Tax=Lysobacter soli TaxID=453783 RepID=UPI00240FDC85|nr:hypothetical protein [Lysobacter soli]